MVMGGGAFHCLPLAPPDSGGTLYASAASAPTVSPGSMVMAVPSFSFVLVLDHMVPPPLYHVVCVPAVISPGTRGQRGAPLTSSTTTTRPRHAAPWLSAEL